MRLKTYLTFSMVEALDLIRKELGSDAVIVSSQQEGKYFRVTAAVESKDPLLTPGFKVTKNKAYTALQVMDLFCRCLDFHIVPQEVADILLSRLKALTQQEKLYNLELILPQLLPCAPLSFNKASTHLVVGPSGAGKSMTTAKLASEYILAGHHPYMVTLDTLKAGAYEQLQTYAQALKASFESFHDLKGLLNFMTIRNQNKPVIIDTPGINIFDDQDLSYMQELSLRLNLSPLLVHPAGTDPYELRDRLPSYQNLGVTSLILTRSDTSLRFGTLLTALSQNNLSVSHIGLGPELGNRLRSATAPLLLKLLTGPLKTPSLAEEFQPLWKETPL